MLTPEEIQAAKTGKLLYKTAPTGVKMPIWYDNEDVWPSWAVAQLRGAFKNMGQASVYYPMAKKSLEDVARALGYANGTDYNDATISDPDEVYRRLAAL